MKYIKGAFFRTFGQYYLSGSKRINLHEHKVICGCTTIVLDDLSLEPTQLRKIDWLYNKVLKSTIT